MTDPLESYFLRWLCYYQGKEEAITLSKDKELFILATQQQKFETMYTNHGVYPRIHVSLLKQRVKEWVLTSAETSTQEMTFQPVTLSLTRRFLVVTLGLGNSHAMFHQALGDDRKETNYCILTSFFFWNYCYITQGKPKQLFLGRLQSYHIKTRVSELTVEYFCR